MAPSPPSTQPRHVLDLLNSGPIRAAVCAATTVLVTVALSVPAHGVLAGGFDAAAHARLVGTNWLRTAAWTVGAATSLLLLWQYRGATA